MDLELKAYAKKLSSQSCLEQSAQTSPYLYFQLYYESCFPVRREWKAMFQLHVYMKKELYLSNLSQGTL